MSNKMLRRCNTWEALRRDIFKAVLYSTPTSGEGEDILLLVKTFLADYSKLSISHLKHVLRDVKKGSDHYVRAQLLRHVYDEPVPKLPGFTCRGGNVVAVEPGDPRQNKWELVVKFETKPTQARWSREDEFLVIVKKSYKASYGDDENILDVYNFHTRKVLVKKRRGEVKNLLEDDAFLYYLRDLVLCMLYRIQRVKICNGLKPRIPVFQDGVLGQSYTILCGAAIVDGHSKCQRCLGNALGEWAAGL